MATKDVLGFLTKKPERDTAADAAFEERFLRNIGPAFLPLVEDIDQGNHSEYLLKGGRGSLKSSFTGLVIPRLLRADPRGNALVLRKVAATMRDTVYAQILWALDALGVYDEWECTVSPMKMIHKETRQEIMFRGLDDPRKIKSIKPRRGYFRAVWFEEGEEYDGYEEIRNVMQSAGRGKKAEAITFISYNPPKSANNWINKEAMEPRAGRLVHHSSYLEAPPAWLGDRFLREAEDLRERNELAWRHEYMGEAVGTGGSVFSNLVIRKIAPEERSRMWPRHHGLDFGYSSDPSALISAYWQEGERTAYLLDEYYKGGAGFDALERAAKKATRDGGQIWADTEPRTIAELHGRGVKIAAARKGRRSRPFGLMWLEELTAIVIDPDACPNAAREFAAFEHVRDPKTGEWRADYQDGNDHTIDALRYALWPIIHKNKRSKYFSGKGAV
jgi:phage terminase large subunit